MKPPRSLRSLPPRGRLSTFGRPGGTEMTHTTPPCATLAAGFTLKWYAQLANDGEMLAGLWLSLQIAFMTACGSVVLGTFAAFALIKYKRFFGRTLFSGMVNAPLVMPEVVVGLSLLLMLVSVQRALGFPERGLVKIGRAHV